MGRIGLMGLIGTFAVAVMLAPAVLFVTSGVAEPEARVKTTVIPASTLRITVPECGTMTFFESNRTVNCSRFFNLVEVLQTDEDVRGLIEERVEILRRSRL